MSRLFPRLWTALASVCVLCVASSTLFAAPLDLPGIEDETDIFSSYIDVNFDATTGRFSAVGRSITFGPSSNNEFIRDAPGTGYFGDFVLTVDLDSNGNLAAGGVATLTITGQLPGRGFTSGTLLEGTVTDIGFDSTGGDPLEFLFDVTGGDAMSLYDGQTGVILSGSGSNFSGSWDQDFSFTNGVADTGSVIPSPIAGSLGLLGLGFVFGLRPRRARLGSDTNP